MALVTINLTWRIRPGPYPIFYNLFLNHATFTSSEFKQIGLNAAPPYAWQTLEITPGDVLEVRWVRFSEGQFPENEAHYHPSASGQLVVSGPTSFTWWVGGYICRLSWDACPEADSYRLYKDDVFFDTTTNTYYDNAPAGNYKISSVTNGEESPLSEVFTSSCVDYDPEE
jgi:hypothetical protein